MDGFYFSIKLVGRVRFAARFEISLCDGPPTQFQTFYDQMVLMKEASVRLVKGCEYDWEELKLDEIYINNSLEWNSEDHNGARVTVPILFGKK